MEGLWLVSYISLWFVVALEGLMLMVVLRQIGMLLVGRAPRGARAVDVGPRVGEKFPEVIREDLEGQLVNIGTETKHDILLIFVSAGCPACVNLMIGVAALASNTKKEDLEIVLMSAEDRWPHRDSEKRIKGVHYVVFPDYVNTFKVGLTPFAYLIDKHGVVLTKGMVNDIQHLESLLNTRDVGAPTVVDLAEMNGSEQKKSLLEQEYEKGKPSEFQEETVNTQVPPEN